MKRRGGSLDADAQPGRNRLWSCLSRFRRDVRGAYAVELGLLAMPFFGLIFGFMEITYVTFAGEQLQAAVTKASRQVMTGQAQLNNYDTASKFVSNLLCPTDGSRILPSFMDCSKLFVDVRVAADFTTADMTNTFYTQTLKYCLGQPSTIVVLRVVYPMDSIFPLSIYNQYLGLANNVPNVPGWKHILMGSAVFETEAYVGGAPAC